MDKNNFKETVESLIEGMDQYFTSKTIVGEPINTDNGIIIPLSEVSVGLAAGAMAQDKKNSGAGGLGAKITPSALLVISNGHTKLINVKQQDAVTKILDMVPDVLNKIKPDNQEDNNSDESAEE